MAPLIALLVILCPPAGASTHIPLTRYLEQVQGTNQGYQGTSAAAVGFSKASEESTLPFSPEFFANAQYTDDRRQTLVPLFEGNRTVTSLGQAGFKKLFGFGLQSQLSYNLTSTALYGVSPQLVPASSLVTGGFALTVTQSLWQNGFGKIDQLTSQAVGAQDLANSFSNTYQLKTLLADAESRYWTLAIAREIVTIQRASADRTITIRDFNEKRARAHLIDESDLLTSDAQAKTKGFDLKNALDNARTAARAFNSARQVDSDVVDENLELPDSETLTAIPVPSRAAMRADVKSAEQSEIAVSAQADAAAQRQLPTLNLVGTVSSNGLETTSGAALSDTTSSKYPYYQVGLNFGVPLDFGTVSSVRRAYGEQIKGAELNYQRRLFDQENDWKELTKRFSEAKERLSIAVDVEKAQKLKLQREASRQKQGLTTTYQVFQYELDYLTSELNRLQTQATILGLVAQMKTFQDSEGGSR